LEITRNDTESPENPTVGKCESSEENIRDCMHQQALTKPSQRERGTLTPELSHEKAQRTQKMKGER
jgi:hypothetical protein